MFSVLLLHVLPAVVLNVVVLLLLVRVAVSCWLERGFEVCSLVSTKAFVTLVLETIVAVVVKVVVLVEVTMLFEVVVLLEAAVLFETSVSLCVVLFEVAAMLSCTTLCGLSSVVVSFATLTCFDC